MRKIRLSALLVTCVLFYIGNAQATEEVSIINLIATPEKYQGQEVMVAGYAIFGIEVDAIYFTNNDVSYGITKNSICLSGLDEYFEHQQNMGLLSTDEIKHLNKSYVLVTGSFDGKQKGHAEMHSGCLKKITKIHVINKIIP